MLGKMLKHEFQATARLYLPLFAFAIVMTPILALLFRWSSKIIPNDLIGGLFTGFSMLAYVLIMIALCVASFLFIVVRFYRTIATSEAYLTFTLPVKPHQILTSKLLVGAIWEMLSTVVVLFSIYIMLEIQGSDVPRDVFYALSTVNPVLEELYGSAFFFYGNIGLIIIISSFTGTLTFFLAICLGQIFNEHRVICCIGMYVAIYMVSQIISTVFMLPFMVLNLDNVVTKTVTYMNVEAEAIPSLSFFWIVMGLELLLGVLYYIGCMLVMKKKINVR